MRALRTASFCIDVSDWGPLPWGEWGLGVGQKIQHAAPAITLPGATLGGAHGDLAARGGDFEGRVGDQPGHDVAGDLPPARCTRTAGRLARPVKANTTAVSPAARADPAGPGDQGGLAARRLAVAGLEDVEEHRLLARLLRLDQEVADPSAPRLRAWCPSARPSGTRWRRCAPWPGAGCR